MRPSFPPFAFALSLALAAPLVAIAPCGVGLAQEQKPGEEGQIKQIALTDKQIDAYLAAKKDIDAVIEKIPESQSEQPDPKTMAQLDQVAKKYKFADYAEYDGVEGNIELVIEGFDPQAKKYIGAEAAIKHEISELKAQKGMPPKDKKEALDQLNEELKAVQPIQFPANIELVTKNFDKISAAMPQAQQAPQKQ
jgi:hypothetical protein